MRFRLEKTEYFDKCFDELEEISRSRLQMRPEVKYEEQNLVLREKIEKYFGKEYEVEDKTTMEIIDNTIIEEMRKEIGYRCFTLPSFIDLRVDSIPFILKEWPLTFLEPGGNWAKKIGKIKVIDNS